MFARWRAALRDNFKRLTSDGFRELPRVRNRGGAADELRMRTIEFADALQPPENIGEMAAINAAIVVQLINDYVPQILKQLRPFRVVREDPGVEHVGIREDDVSFIADCATGV